MMGSALFVVVLGLGVAVPFAKSGKPVGTAFRWSAALFVTGAVLVGLGLLVMTAEQRLNGAVNLGVISGVLPAGLGAVGLVMTATVQGLRILGFRAEEDQT